MTLDMLLKVGGVVAAMSAGTATIWKVEDWTETRPVILRELKQAQLQIDQLSKSTVYLQFKWLSEKAKQPIPLSPEEQRDLCQSAKVLGFPPPIQGCPQ